jgi:ribonuclease HI
MKEEKIIIHTDGGARGNPGPAACAFVAESGNKKVGHGSLFLGASTNNYAEYQGIILALKWAVKKFSISDHQLSIYFNSDSELVVKQLNGLYKIKNQNLKALNDEIKKIISTHNLKISINNIPRSENKFADQLVNEELDNKFPRK